MGVASQTGTPRIDWVDCAKGICIIMVVMMHSTLGVEDAAGKEGFMHALVAFAKPFRMPDFFLISGLFVANVIDRDWRAYLDRKVVHFAYFYILWVTIQFAFKAPGFSTEIGAANVAMLYAQSFIEPFGTLWFIYLLPIFFVVTKLVRNVPPLAVWIVAAALEMSHLHTGWTVPDEFAARFVYFYTGYLMARHVLAFADLIGKHKWLALIGLEVWAVINSALVYSGLAALPVFSLALGYAGALAVITVAVLISRIEAFNPVRYCGENSIVIYLAFFLPMGAMRTLLIKTGVISSVGVVALIVTLAGIFGALAIWWAVRETRFSFLFSRPESLKLSAHKPLAMQPAE
jgi:uncharacterized membrane protein YcfT